VLGRLSRALRLALPRALLWAVEWMLRDVGRSARGSEETPTPGELPVPEERAVSPESDRHVGGSLPNSSAALRAQHGETRPLRPGQHRAEASEEQQVPDRSLEALRRRLADAERRIDHLTARTPHPASVRVRAEPEWAEEVRARAQRVLGDSPRPGLRSQPETLPPPRSEPKPPTIREPIRAKSASPGVSQAPSEIVSRSTSSSIPSVPTARHEQVSASVPHTAAEAPVRQRPVGRETKTLGLGPRTPARVEVGEPDASAAGARVTGYQRSTAEAESAMQHVTPPVAGQPGQTTKAASLPVLNLQPRPGLAHRGLLRTRRPGRAFEPGARDAAVPLGHGVADTQSPAASRRSLRVLPPADGPGRRERTIEPRRELEIQARGERSRSQPASLWPLLPDEVESRQPETERSPWPELPEEPMLIERERPPAIHSGDAWRHERLEREQRGDLWNG